MEMRSFVFVDGDLCCCQRPVKCRAPSSQCSLDGGLQGDAVCSKRQEFQKITPFWVSLGGWKGVCVPFRG